MRFFMLAGLMVGLTGCMTSGPRPYEPDSGVERQVFDHARRDVRPADVRKDFQSFCRVDMAWVGIIREVEFRDKSDCVQAAFLIEHRDYDWMENQEEWVQYALSAKGDGLFTTGWVIPHPTRISRLEKQARVGDMVVVYGRPYSMKSDGTIHLRASFVHPISAEDVGTTSAK